ncbi:MAG: nicotinate-nucleotide adenylyltransferase [Steroidobacteraceae bacterium]|jgi:nicotinate-nucleotide adenylyltransferase
MNGPIGIFGGTFDPIHVGHLRTGFELLQELSLAEVRWIPAGNPGHRDAPLADPGLRLAMVRAAVADQPGFVVDDREVYRTGVTYTVDTLRELRAEWPTRPLCLLLGMDAFLGLPSWREWERIVELAHLVVAHRPGWQMPAEGVLGALLANRATRVVRDLHAAIAGRVHVHAVTQLEISSTGLRDIIVSGRDPRFLVSEPVREIIRDTGCYARHGRSPR